MCSYRLRLEEEVEPDGADVTLDGDKVVVGIDVADDREDVVLETDALVAVTVDGEGLADASAFLGAFFAYLPLGASFSCA